MPFITKHRPPHLHLDNMFLFITAKIYGGFSYMALDETKDFFWQLLEEKAEKYNFNLEGRVVLGNHYHLLIDVDKGDLVSKFIREVHGASAHHIKKNLPNLVVNEEQVLIRDKTPFDKRQERRLDRELEREIKFATTSATTKLIQFIARYKNQFKPSQTKVCYYKKENNKSGNPKNISK